MDTCAYYSIPILHNSILIIPFPCSTRAVPKHSQDWRTSRFTWGLILGRSRTPASSHPVTNPSQTHQTDPNTRKLTMNRYTAWTSKLQSLMYSTCNYTLQYRITYCQFSYYTLQYRIIVQLLISISFSGLEVKACSWLDKETNH